MISEFGYGMKPDTCHIQYQVGIIVHDSSFFADWFDRIPPNSQESNHEETLRLSKGGLNEFCHGPLDTPRFVSVVSERKNEMPMP